MIKQPPLDEAAERARRETSARMKSRAVWVLIVGSALLFAVIAALDVTGHAALVLSRGGQTITAVYAGALFIYFIVMMSRYYVPSIEAEGRRLIRRKIDVYQRRWRWTILLQIFLTIPFFVFLPQVFLVFGSAHPFMRTILCAIVALLMTILVFLLLVGPGLGGRELLNDEFVTALRARTMRFAYVLTMLLLGTVLFIALWRPDLTLTALSWALYAGFAVPALYYVVADWRASIEHEERDG